MPAAIFVWYMSLMADRGEALEGFAAFALAGKGR
jgi:hypothetical protein